MAKTAREKLARLFGDSEPAGSFSAQLRAPAHLLQLEVSGVGPVSLPMRAPQVKKLIAVARPAMFGRGEETLTDASVRDAWELTPDQVTLGGPGWTALLDGALEHFRDQLGLPLTARLRAEPHSMLVYGKGQFFLSHQDSEKDDAMVGTLVVSLPSVHTGGELVVEHAGASAAYRTSRDELSLVAFYADCRHQVTPIRSGYRVTLTFNLLADTAGTDEHAGPAAELAHCLTEHFSTPATPRYGRGDLDPPNRLVFLLDHEYTQRSLSWSRLKGVDVERAARLRAAAEQTGFEAVLALAEVKETWDALPSGGDGWNDYAGDAGEDSGDYELNDLIDDEITLGWWTGPDGTGGEPISLHVADHEVCAATPSVRLTPFQTEYEGYMGNYGNTLDRWYWSPSSPTSFPTRWTTHDGSWFRVCVLVVFLAIFVGALVVSAKRAIRAAAVVLAVGILRPGWNRQFDQVSAQLRNSYRCLPLTMRLEQPDETPVAIRPTIASAVDNMLTVITQHWPEHGRLVFVNARPHDAYLVGTRLRTFQSTGPLTLIQPAQDGPEPFDTMELRASYLSYTIDWPSWRDAVQVSTGEHSDGEPGVLDVVVQATARSHSMPADVEASGRAFGHLARQHIVIRVDYGKLAAPLVAELPLFISQCVREHIRAVAEQSPVHTVQLYTAAPNFVPVALGYYGFTVLGVPTVYMAAYPSGDSAVPRRYERFKIE